MFKMKWFNNMSTDAWLLVAPNISHTLVGNKIVDHSDALWQKMKFQEYFN